MTAYIDTHVHFWNPDHLTYPWLDQAPAIKRPFLPGHLALATAGLDLAGIVFVQADCLPEQSLAEAEWVTALAQVEPRIRGIVAHAPLEAGEAARDALAALQKLPLVKGIRRLIQSEPLGFCVQPDFVRGVQLLPEYGFSFDICIYHPQLGDVLRLVEQCPDVSFILDHIGKPGIKDGIREPWMSQIRELAAFPNVHCKLSGMVTEADHAHWTPDDLKPYMEHVLDCFGPERTVFGSDWPVVNLAAPYRKWFDLVRQGIAHFSEADQKKILHDNAVAFYRLGGSE